MYVTSDTIHAFESEEDLNRTTAELTSTLWLMMLRTRKEAVSFLTLVGLKVYGLAENLLSPKDLVSCSYDKIKDVYTHMDWLLWEYRNTALVLMVYCFKADEGDQG